MPVERHLRALEAAIDGPMTLGELTHRMHHAGFGLVIIFVCLPFLQPLPIRVRRTASSAVSPFCRAMRVKAAAMP